jgi:hypothetical protein
MKNVVAFFLLAFMAAPAWAEDNSRDLWRAWSAKEITAYLFGCYQMQRALCEANWKRSPTLSPEQQNEEHIKFLACLPPKHKDFDLMAETFSLVDTVYENEAYKKIEPAFIMQSYWMCRKINKTHGRDALSCTYKSLNELLQRSKRLFD